MDADIDGVVVVCFVEAELFLEIKHGHCGGGMWCGVVWCGR